MNMATLKILLFLTFLEIIDSLGENSTASNVEVGEHQNESELTKLLDLLKPKVSKYPNVPISEDPNIRISQYPNLIATALFKSWLKMKLDNSV